MGIGAFTSYFDVAQLVLWMFWIFFAGLVYYLVRENHREGYPMDADRGVITGWPLPRGPKVFRMPDGHEYVVPKPESLPPSLNAAPAHGWNGAPLEPTGNPLLAGVGPGSWTPRLDTVELNYEGKPKVVPVRNEPDYRVAPGDVDPRGLPVLGADGQSAGTVKDLWIDISEVLFRYLEVEVATAGGARHVLVPLNFCRITKADGIRVHALYAHQFADIPGTKSPDTVTTLEEEKICAYFGAGLLYADDRRADPLV